MGGLFEEPVRVQSADVEQVPGKIVSLFCGCIGDYVAIPRHLSQNEVLVPLFSRIVHSDAQTSRRGMPGCVLLAERLETSQLWGPTTPPQSCGPAGGLN
eukprot:10625609-Heterocapsa_arctica.AAC.1